MRGKEALLIERGKILDALLHADEPGMLRRASLSERISRWP
jgi:hypothetical protein